MVHTRMVLRRSGDNPLFKAMDTLPALHGLYDKYKRSGKARFRRRKAVLCQLFHILARKRLELPF